jgi:uncharacterized protein
MWVVVFFIFLSAIVIPMILISQSTSFEITFWHQAMVIVVTSLICQRLSGNGLSSLFRLTKTFWFELLIGLCLGSLLMLIPAVILSVVGLVHWDLNDLVTDKLFPAIWTMAGVVLAEELLFRGFIFQRLIAGLGAWPAQIIIALLFLLTHSANLDINGPTKVLAIVNIFTASMLFGMAYLKTKSLAMPIAIHFSANVMQGTILGFSVSGHDEVSILKPELAAGYEFLTGGMFGIEASLVGLFALWLVLFVFYFRYDKSTFEPPQLIRK